MEGGPGWSDVALDVNVSTVLRVRRSVRHRRAPGDPGAQAADRVYPRALDGAQEAHLIALTCGTPADGHACWSLRLLADELVRLEVVETISYETVRQALQQTPSSRT